MKDSELLRKSRHLIATKEHNAICASISYAAGTPNTPQARSLQVWIQSMLGNHSYLNSWLEENGYIIRKRDYNELGYATPETYDKLRATRLAWLDWMIEQCEIAEAKETK